MSPGTVSPSVVDLIEGPVLLGLLLVLLVVLLAEVHAAEVGGLELELGPAHLLDVEGALRGLVAALDVARLLGCGVS